MGEWESKRLGEGDMELKEGEHEGRNQVNENGAKERGCGKEN